jgi:hypothetical protein
MSRFDDTVQKLASCAVKSELFKTIPSALVEKTAAPTASTASFGAKVLEQALPKVLAGAALGIGTFGLSKAYDNMFGSRTQVEEHQRELGKLTAQSQFKAEALNQLKPLHTNVFNSVMQDQVIKDADPSLMKSTFDTMRKFAPNLAADSNAAKSFLREHAIYGTGPSYAALKNLADAEQAISRAGGVTADIKTADWKEQVADAVMASHLLNTAGKPAAVLGTHALAGAVPGALAGAIADDDNRLGGALKGGLTGAALGTAVGGGNLALRHAVEKEILKDVLRGEVVGKYLQGSSVLSPALGTVGGALAGSYGSTDKTAANRVDGEKTAFSWRNLGSMAGNHALGGAAAGAVGGAIGAESGHRLEGAARGAAMGGVLGGLSGAGQYAGRRAMGQHVDAAAQRIRAYSKAAPGSVEQARAAKRLNDPRLQSALAHQLTGFAGSTALGGLGSTVGNWGLGRNEQ